MSKSVGRRRATALAVTVALAMSACGGSATSRSDLVASFRRKDQSGRRFTQRQAECAADATIRSLTKDEIKTVAADGVDKLSPTSQARWGDAIKGCLTS